MGRHRKKPNQLPRWSELCPDLLRCVFKRLSFIDLDRAKFVCRWWYSTSKGCIPKPIPCGIIFSPKKETSDSSQKRKQKAVKKEKSSKNSCLLFVPGEKVSVYKTRDLGVGFAKSSCLATCRSWLLMFKHPWEIYILNILTLERIGLPRPHSIYPDVYIPACLWIDDKTKDYLVLWSVNYCEELLFTKNGYNSWRNIYPTAFRRCYQIVYNHKDHKVYTEIDELNRVCVWDFSGDNPSQERYLLSFDLIIINSRRYMAVTVSGQVLHVDCRWDFKEPWQFHIYKLDAQENKWVKVDSLGDEALILDIGHTVVANDITGIKKNSIYFYDHDRHPSVTPKDQLFVYDLTTRTMETMKTTRSKRAFPSDCRWFFPGLTS